MRKKQGYGSVTYQGRVSHIRTLVPPELDPLKVYPEIGDTPKDLFRWLLFCQQRQYGKTILNIMPNQPMHMRHLKGLPYDPLTIKQAIWYAAIRLKRPFSIRWIRFYCDIIEEMKANEQQ